MLISIFTEAINPPLIKKIRQKKDYNSVRAVILTLSPSNLISVLPSVLLFNPKKLVRVSDLMNFLYTACPETKRKVEQIYL